MSKNIEWTPRTVLKGKTSSGESFTAEQWDFDSLAAFDAVGFFVMLLVGAVVGCLLSPVFLIVTLYRILQNDRVNIAVNIAGILISFIFVYGCSHDWLNKVLLSFFVEDNGLKNLIVLNYACIGGNVFLLISRSQKSNISLLVGMVGIVIGGFIGVGENASYIKEHGYYLKKYGKAAEDPNKVKYDGFGYVIK